MNGDEYVLASRPLSGQKAPGLTDRLARELVLRALGGISEGQLVLLEGARCFGFGREQRDGLSATVRVHSPAFYRNIAFGGSIGAGEAYMDGFWSCDDLPTLMRIMVRNQAVQDRLEGGLARLAGLARRLRHRGNDNSRRGSRRNIAAHYDLGNAFYRLFLDPSMAYSCGIFEQPETTLHEASIAKFERICSKLQLAPGMRLLEIGTGWGGFALHAARRYGCHVTTTTISGQQHAYVAAQIREAGLGDRITLLQSDYRDLSGSFDRLVSIEMIEAVGHRHLPAFFAVCARHLEADGLALIQAITVPDRIYPRYLKTPDFINRHIFPGGCCPSPGALAAAAGTADLALIHLEDLSPHYVRTLQEWRRAFHGNLAGVRALGYDERFLRMWDYYLAYCEGGFAERFTGLVQQLYARPGSRPVPAVSTRGL
ncbi:MAG: class I SAM-dependent methyltransferase [Deltaproteobacteria bacterium]|nr:MAG: class I SAM-dependent methyltransferase [Deltaproteobacteria bacterium]